METRSDSYCFSLSEIDVLLQELDAEVIDHDHVRQNSRMT